MRYPSDVEDVFTALFGTSISNVERFLLDQCRVEGKGFKSQYTHDKRESVATSATILSALSLTSKVERSKCLSFLDEINPDPQYSERFVDADGRESNWSLGLTTYAESIVQDKRVGRKLRYRVRELVNRQNKDGGCSFIPKDNYDTEIIYSFYPVLTLLRLTTSDISENELSKDSIKEVIRYLENYEPTHMTEDILLYFLFLNFRSKGYNISPALNGEGIKKRIKDISNIYD